MRFTTGVISRKDNYFSRKEVEKKVGNVLMAGHNVYLASPRRTGKTSLIHHLLENGHRGLYLYVGDLKTQTDCYDLMIQKLTSNIRLGKFLTARIKFINTLYSIRKLFKKISVKGAEVEFTEITNDLSFKRLMQILHIYDRKIEKSYTVFLDEYPDLLLGIKNESSENGRVFLSRCKKMRESLVNIKFLYTGSIGLYTIANEFNEIDLLGDLKKVEIPELTKQEAKLLCEKLLRFNASDILVVEGSIEYLISRMGWLNIYEIQKILSQIVEDVYANEEDSISISVIKSSYDTLLRNSDNAYFYIYLNRLKKYPVYSELSEVLLNIIACNPAISIKEVKSHADTRKFDDSKVNKLIRLLIGDGYINEYDDILNFNSNLLLDWWKLNVANCT